MNELTTVRSGFLAVAILLLAPTSDAQYSFDLITYDSYEVNDQSSGLGDSWAILVNTGNAPIPLSEWAAALNYAKLDASVGNLALEPQFPGPTMLLPGQAIGSFSSDLVNLLDSGETFVSAQVLSLQLGSPFPQGTTQELEWTFVLGDRQVAGRTDFVFTSTPGSHVARRHSSSPATSFVMPAGSGCAGILSSDSTGLSPPMTTISTSSDLPIIGNARFGIRTSGLTGGVRILGLDTMSGAFTFRGCPILLGLSGAFGAVPAGVVTSVPIPDDMVLVGLTVYAQVLSRDPLTGVWTSTDGLAFQIGSI